MSDFERRVTFQPAWDRHLEGRGVSGVTIDFALIGPAGAVRLPVLTHFVLPETEEWWSTLGSEPPRMPVPTQVSLHSRIERAGWCARADCDLVGACWTEALSFTSGDKVWEALLREGDAGLWRELERVYSEYLVLQTTVVEAPICS